MSWLRRLVLFALAAAAGLLLAEFACSRWLPLGAPLVRLDEVLLHTNRRDAHSLLVLAEANGGDWIHLRTNSHGLRGEELGPRGERLRLAVYGDSFVFAGNTREEDTFVQVLGRELGQRLGRPVEALNAGVTGYGPDQALLKFERECGELAPEFVVLCLCAHNDHGDLVRNRLFELDAAGGLRRQAPTLSPELVREEQVRTAGEGGWALPRLLAASPRAETTRDAPYLTWYLRAARAEHLAASGPGNPVVQALFEDYWDADLALEPASASATHKRRLMAALLARFKEVCTERQLPLFVVVIPSAIDAARSHPVTVDDSLYPAYEPKALTASLALALERASIAHTDLFETLSVEGGDWAFHLAGDFHWSPAGQGAAAATVAEALARWPGLPR
jgi:hypothetical protein